MTDFKDDEINNYYEEETFTKSLNREDTIENQIRTVSYFYSRCQWRQFECSLKVLIALLPKDIRNKFTPLPINLKETGDDGIERHYKQFVKIQETLETDTNLVFRKKFIKTFE